MLHHYGLPLTYCTSLENFISRPRCFHPSHALRKHSSACMILTILPHCSANIEPSCRAVADHTAALDAWSRLSLVCLSLNTASNLFCLTLIPIPPRSKSSTVEVFRVARPPIMLPISYAPPMLTQRSASIDTSCRAVSMHWHWTSRVVSPWCASPLTCQLSVRP